VERPPSTKSIEHPIKSFSVWKYAAPKTYHFRWSEHLTTNLCIIAATVLGVIMLLLLWREIDILF
jgi:hypothetical protein